jgi:hypothetical protein
MGPPELVEWLVGVAADHKVVQVRVAVPQLLVAVVVVLREMEPAKHGARRVVKTMVDVHSPRAALAVTGVAQVVGVGELTEDLAAAADHVPALPVAAAEAAAIQVAAVEAAAIQVAAAAVRLSLEPRHQSTLTLHETQLLVT